MTAFIKARADLQKAREARSNGLEGQARVLCRMAAASAIQEYMAAAGQPAPAGSGYETIQAFALQRTLPVEIQFALGHLLMRVDQDYNLPADVDLIADVEKLLAFFESEHS